MTDTDTDLRCARCGGPTTIGQMVYSLLRDADGKRGPLRRDHVFCSHRCLQGNLARLLAQAQCRVCGRPWDRQPGDPGAGGPGRPPTFCSKACRSAHEKMIRRALKDLARGGDPKPDVESIDEAAALALTLHRPAQLSVA